jgi:hypothetical protein
MKGTTARNIRRKSALERTYKRIEELQVQIKSAKTDEESEQLILKLKRNQEAAKHTEDKLNPPKRESAPLEIERI